MAHFDLEDVGACDHHASNVVVVVYVFFALLLLLLLAEGGVRFEGELAIHDVIDVSIEWAVLFRGNLCHTLVKNEVCSEVYSLQLAFEDASILGGNPHHLVD